MRMHPLFSISTLLTTSLAVNLFAARYDGVISTLSLTKSHGNYTLVETSRNTNSSKNPSWLQKHPNSKFIFATEENFSGPNGSIASYSKSAAGVLTLLDKEATSTGPVNIAFYANGKAAATAGYASSTIQTFTISPKSGNITLQQTFTYTLSQPGAIPSRQDRPHPHQVLLDPSGSYLISPDLGADLLRVYSVDSKTLLLKEEEAIEVGAGSGPRHGAFLEKGGKTYYFLVTELSNETIVYRVTYGKGKFKKLSFEEVFRGGNFGPNPVPEGSAAAEVFVTPDQRYLLTSSRYNNGTTGPDTLQIWCINDKAGHLKFKQLHTAGGVNPRHFSINKKGDLIAVALQYDSSVVILERDVKSGLIGKEVARIGGLLYVNAVIWDD